MSNSTDASLDMNSPIQGSCCSTGPTCTDKAFEKLMNSLGKAFAQKSSQVDIKTILNNFQCHLSELNKFIHFNPRRYTRNLVMLDENFSVILICWEPGQESPVHTHSNSCTWMKVLDGTLQQVYYNQAKKPYKKNVFPKDTVAHCNEHVGMHKMENCGKTRAISLHVYSPPYVECGDGDELTPVVYCNAVAVEHKRQQERLKCQLEQQRIVYSNFQELTELLRKEIGPKPDIPKIRKMIENFAINPK